MTESLKEYHKVVEELEADLPSIPLIMDELLRIAGDQDAALFAVRDFLKLDKSIYSKILRIANSVAHREGIVERISELTEAMQRIGLEKVKRIALKTSVFQVFQEEKIRTFIQFGKPLEAQCGRSHGQSDSGRRLGIATGCACLRLRPLA